MPQGSTCHATCSGDSQPQGQFVCSFTEILGSSMCVEPRMGVVAQLKTIVAGSLHIHLSASPPLMVLGECLTASLATKISFVTHLSWTLGRQLRGRFLDGVN